MEELLPLIIGIVWLVYTIYSKGKKKAARKTSPGDTQETKAPSILEQLFNNNEIIGSQPYETYEEPIEDQMFEHDDVVVKEQVEESRPFLKNELANFMFEGQSAVTVSSDSIKEEMVDWENQAEGSDFDLQKAIIYSEILNAPYIGYK